ncbi:MAG: ATP-dependent RNA helicase HrpA, partial [Verrucomicrobiales bacterium]
DVLVFLPGEREIREAANLLEGRDFRGCEVMPVFARLSLADQERIFKPSARRRIFLATNVAETSLTLPGIVSVVDSGLARVSRYSPTRGIQSLQIEMISQASARQRRGRCGRVREGRCVRLYEEEALENAAEFTDPEIRRSALSGVILRMLALGLGDVRDFDFVDPPNARAIREGVETLVEIGALKKGGKAHADATSLTEIGWRLAKLPVDPRLGRMLIEAERREVFEEMLIIVSGLSVMDVRERPQEVADKADAAQAKFLDQQSDFGVYLNLWKGVQEFACPASPRPPEEGNGTPVPRKGKIRANQLRKWCVKHFLNYRRVREWLQVAEELRRLMRKKGKSKAAPAGSQHHGGKDTSPGSQHHGGRADLYAEVHKCVLAGVPRQVGVWDKEKRHYHGVANRNFAVFPGSGLFKEKRALWVLGFELVETSRLWARKVAEIDPRWVEEVVPHLCRRRYHSPIWDEQQGAVYGKEDVMLGGLSLVEGRRCYFGKVNPKGAHEVFVREALVEGRMRGKVACVDRLREVRAEVESAERKLRRVGYLWHEESLYDFFFERVPVGVDTTKGFLDWLRREGNEERLMIRFSDVVWEEGVEESLRLFPDEVWQGERAWPVVYVSDPEAVDDGLVFEVGIEELEDFPAGLNSWGVPGILAERVELLIRSLPKDWRKLCQPVAATVEAFLVEWADWEAQGTLEAAVLDFLRERTGAEIDGMAPERLPRHLRPQLRVRDEKGREMALGEDAEELRERLAEELRARREAAANEEWEMTGGEVWSFGEVPVETAEGGVFPALVDEGETVGMRAFLDRAEAVESHRAGVVRLFLLAHEDHGHYVKKNFPFGMGGKLMLPLLPEETREDFRRVAAEGALEGGNGDLPRDEEGFLLASERAKGEWYECGRRLAEALEALSESDAKVRAWMEENRGDRHLDEVVRDFEEEREWLLGGDFAWRAGYARLSRYQRYFQGMEERMRRLREQPLVRDEEKRDRFLPLWDDWFARWQAEPASARLREIGWLLAEWRLEVFAPGVPRSGAKISEKIIGKALDSLR